MVDFPPYAHLITFTVFFLSVASTMIGPRVERLARLKTFIHWPVAGGSFTFARAMREQQRRNRIAPTSGYWNYDPHILLHVLPQARTCFRFRVTFGAVEYPETCSAE